MKWPNLELRGWVTVGMFILSFYLLTLMAFVPGLRTDDFFKTIGTLILGSAGLGLMFNFVYGGSKASNEAVTTVNDIAKQSSPQNTTQTEQMTVKAENVEVNKEKK